MLETFARSLSDNIFTAWLGMCAWSFPIAEVFHLVTLGTFFGGMMVLDLRLLGCSRFISSKLMMQHILRIAWWSFAGATVSGLVLFFVMPWEYPVNPIFQLKMGLMLLAGINALWMHKILTKDIQQWDMSTAPPIQVRVSAVISMCLWIAVLACGRLIAYFYVTFGFF